MSSGPAGMTEIVQEAKIAREKLAEALGLLQSAEAGSLIDSVAPPVAMAMGALHSIEVALGRTANESVPQALGHVQKALAALQFVPSSNPVVDDATAHVAEALGLLHRLSRSLSAPNPPAAAVQPTVQVPIKPVGTTERPAHAQTVISSRPAEPEARGSEPSSPIGKINPTPQAKATAAGLDQTALSREVPARALDQTALSREAPVFADDERPERDKRSAAFAETAVAPSIVQAPPEPQKKPKAPSKPAEKPPGAVLVEANLGAHSDTNFFKGLSGNDVVDDGGIFIATYEIPKPGTPLWIRVTLPGGYEFEAAGAVRWTRDASAGDAAPGFGAIFIDLSHEARQLVYRYVRNREPLFYDDL